MLGRNPLQLSARTKFGVQWRHWSAWMGVGAGLAWLNPACLNPHTDDQPTFAGDSTVVVNPEPASCNDNPLLAGCGAPDAAAADAGAGDANAP